MEGNGRRPDLRLHRLHGVESSLMRREGVDVDVELELEVRLRLRSSVIDNFWA